MDFKEDEKFILKEVPESSEQRLSPSPAAGQGKVGEAQPADPLVGTRISNRYRIVSVLSWAEQGVVAKADDLEDNRQVTIKIFNSELFPDAASLEKFKKEAAAFSALTHKNIAALRDFGVTAEGEPYLVLEDERGERLCDILAIHTPLAPEAVARLFAQFADALEYAQSKGIRYARLDPERVRINLFNDELTLNDFSPVELAARSAPLEDSLESALYASPERCRGEQGGTSGQIYSLACLMYQALTGKPPFAGADLLEIHSQHLYMQPKAMCVACPEHYVPPALEAVVTRSLAKSPAERFRSLAEFREALAGCFLPRAAKAKGKPACALAVLLAVLIPLALTLFYQPRLSSEPPVVTAPPAISIPSSAHFLGLLAGSGNDKVTLPAGDYAVSSINFSGNSCLIPEGAVRIFIVDGAVGAGRPSIYLSGNSCLNSGQSPDRLHVFYQGSREIVLSGNVRLSARLDCPHAMLSAAGASTIRGSVLTAGQKMEGFSRFINEPDSAD